MNLAASVEQAGLLHLPHDALALLLSRCPVQSILSLACCSRASRELASDAVVWSTLLRQRHRILMGDSDPHQALLPSAAFASRTSASTQQWLQLYRACEKEWLSTCQVAPRSCWSLWRGDSSRVALMIVRSSKGRNSCKPFILRRSDRVPFSSRRQILRFAFEDHVLELLAVLAAICIAAGAATSIIACTCLVGLVDVPDACSSFVAFSYHAMSALPISS